MSYMFATAKSTQPTEMCRRCGQHPAAIDAVTRTKRRGEVSMASEEVCLTCFYAPGMPAPAAKPARLPGTLATMDEAKARAEKVLAHVGTRPDIMGDADRGYKLTFDSPLVPGFKPAKA